MLGFGGLAGELDVTVGEGAAFDVLAGQANVVAVLEQGAEGEGFGGGPVDRVVLVRLEPGADLGSGEALVRVEVVSREVD